MQTPAQTRDAQLYGAQAAAGTRWAAQPYQQRIIVRAIMFVINVLASPHYRAGAKPRGGGGGGFSPDREDARAPLPTPDEVAARIAAILGEGAVRHLTELTVTSLMLLEASDLDEWLDNAEEFAHADANEEGLRVRPSAETLYAQLMQYRPDVVSRATMDMLQSHVAQPCTPSEPPQAVQLREALYNALGLCSYELQEVVDFPSWMQTHLAHEVAGSHSLQYVIRRRLALLIGQWGDTLGDTAHRDVAYNVILALLRDPDMAVRVAACEGLLKLVDDVGFFAEAFDPHLMPAVALLFELMRAADMVDTKLRCLNLLTMLMNAMSGRLQPDVVQGVLAAVPALWEDAKEETLMMGAVLVTMTRLVQALGTNVTSIEGFIIEVIGTAADVESEHELYTLEDGLDLWLAFARNLPHASPALLALFPLVAKALARDFEHLQVCMHISESMLLLDGAQMVEVHGAMLAQLFISVLGKVKDAATLIALEVLDTLLVVASERAVELLEVAGVWQQVLRMGVGADAAEESTMVRAACVALLARVAAVNVEAFLALLARMDACSGGGSGAGGGGAAGVETLRHRFVDECLARADNLMLARKRRLVAQGVLNLLALADAETLKRAPAMLVLVNEVLVQEYKDSQQPARAADAPQVRHREQLLMVYLWVVLVVLMSTHAGHRTSATLSAASAACMT